MLIVIAYLSSSSKQDIFFESLSKEDNFEKEFLSLPMTTNPEVSVAAATAGELDQPKPRWMPLEGNPDVDHFFYFFQLNLLFFLFKGFE